MAYEAADIITESLSSIGIRRVTESSATL